MRAATAAYTAVVFDMDGLLLDSERPTRDAWLQSAAALGASLSESDYLDVVGLNHRDSNARMLTLFGGDVRLMDAVRARADAALAAGAPYAPKPGARRLLEVLRAAGVPCAVASSTHVDQVRVRLQRVGLLTHFNAVCGGDEVQRGKPNPDLYLLALERLNATPQNTLAFEDSGHGVRAALAAGLATIAVPDLKAPDPEWLARCLAVLPSLEAAYDRAGEWFGAKVGAGSGAVRAD